MRKGRLRISENHARVSKIYLGMHNSFKLSHIKKVHLLVQVFLFVCVYVYVSVQARERERLKGSRRQKKVDNIKLL